MSRASKIRAIKRQPIHVRSQRHSERRKATGHWKNPAQPSLITLTMPNVTKGFLLGFLFAQMGGFQAVVEQFMTEQGDRGRA